MCASGRPMADWNILVGQTIRSRFAAIVLNWPEIEHALRGHGSLKDVAVVARTREENDTELVGFVVLQEDLEQDHLHTEAGDLDEEGDVEGWKDLYDNLTLRRY